MFYLVPYHGISIHSLRMEGDYSHRLISALCRRFQSTPSAWRETTEHLLRRNRQSLISIHSLRMEGDVSELPVKPVRIAFQSTPSAWRETCCIRSFTCSCVISIHSLRMEGDAVSFEPYRRTAISIHSLRMEGDDTIFPCLRYLIISIHSLRMEGDCIPAVFPVGSIHFNPLPPHGGRLVSSRISTLVMLFQSTPSAWRETPGSSGKYVSGKISIHSLRMEGDVGCFRQIDSAKTFQSTPSAWRETYDQRFSKDWIFHFNPLPPHGGRRLNVVTTGIRRKYFNPLPPHGGRQYGFMLFSRGRDISIHSLRMEGDLSASVKITGKTISIHSLRMEGDDIICGYRSGSSKISIHSLRMEGDRTL